MKARLYWNAARLVHRALTYLAQHAGVEAQNYLDHAGIDVERLRHGD